MLPKKADNRPAGIKKTRMNSSSNSRTYSRVNASGTVLIVLLLTVSASWISNRGADWLQYSILIATFALSLLHAPITHFNKRMLYSFLFLFFSVGLVSLLRPDGSNRSDLLFLFQITLGFFAAATFEANSRIALSLFTRVIYLLCLSSLVLFPLVFLFPSLIVQVPDQFQNLLQGSINVNKRFYTLFGISYFASGQGIEDIWRNQSIFWEPGMLGFFSVLALVVSDSTGSRRREKAVFVLGVLSTFAPGAYALLFIYLGLRIVGAAKRGIMVSGLVMFVFIGIALLSVPMLHKIVVIVFDRDLYTDPSFYIRSTDFWLPYVVALDSPLLGFGTYEPYNNAMKLAIDRNMLGITNSFGAYFYRYGFIWTTFFISWALLAVSRVGPEFGAMPFILFVGIMYEPIGFSSIFIFLLFVMIANRRGRSQFVPAPLSTGSLS